MTRATYDRIADAYRRRTGAAFAGLVDDLDALGELIPPGARVADIGCGPGRDASLLRERGYEVIGLDLSLGMLRAGGAGRCVQADMRALPLATGSLDAVWCQAAMLHVPRPDVPAVVGEFRRVLRDGGALHLAGAAGDDDGWEPCSYDADSPRWFVRHRYEPLAALLAEAGFAVVDVARRVTHRDWLRIRATRTPRSAG